MWDRVWVVKGESNSREGVGRGKSETHFPVKSMISNTCISVSSFTYRAVLKGVLEISTPQCGPLLI